jgi:DNA-binding LacI/PurR family transcriptional regulator/biotin operon repressor
MPDFNILSPSEQVAAYLREELMRGHWSGNMPGGPALARELGIDGKTVWAALNLLEKQGFLVGQGAGKRRKITLPEDFAPPALRVAILDYEPLIETEEWSISMQRQLLEQGHSAFFTDKSLIELGFDVKRIARLVKRTPADAWIVCSAPRDVLQWFVDQEKPTIALFGRRTGLPIAGVGPNHISASRATAKRLLELGHQRIVVLVREPNRAAGPGAAERAIFEEMEKQGVPTGSYNLPDWKDNPEALRRVLNELFRVTPPTALIIDEPFLFHAVKEHLAQRGILAPKNISLICTDPNPTFAWCEPSVAHTRWDHRPIVRRVLQWTNNIARGKEDRRQSLTKAEFVDGGTVGPVPLRSNVE